MRDGDGASGRLNWRTSSGGFREASSSEQTMSRRANGKARIRIARGFDVFRTGIGYAIRNGLPPLRRLLL
jgi:hypothetical protein